MVTLTRVTKHTPGPWRWEAWGDDPKERNTLAAPPSSRADGPSKYFPDLGAQILHLDEPIENEADARLIAAAPLMLAELMSIATGYDHDEDAHKHNNGACRVCNAERAIAAALGDDDKPEVKP